MDSDIQTGSQNESSESFSARTQGNERDSNDTIQAIDLEERTESNPGQIQTSEIMDASNLDNNPKEKSKKKRNKESKKQKHKNKDKNLKDSIEMSGAVVTTLSNSETGYGHFRPMEGPQIIINENRSVPLASDEDLSRMTTPATTPHGQTNALLLSPPSATLDGETPSSPGGNTILDMDDDPDFKAEFNNMILRRRKSSKGSRRSKKSGRHGSIIPGVDDAEFAKRQRFVPE